VINCALIKKVCEAPENARDEGMVEELCRSSALLLYNILTSLLPCLNLSQSLTFVNHDLQLFPAIVLCFMDNSCVRDVSQSVDKFRSTRRRITVKQEEVSPTSV